MAKNRVTQESVPETKKTAAPKMKKYGWKPIARFRGACKNC